MKALILNATTKEIEEKEIVMQANSVYTFFNSILIDELTTLKDHILYTDANAISEKKEPYFIGEQLLVGDALILGRQGFEDADVMISKEDLASLVNYDVNEFYKTVLDLLSATDLNLYRTFALKKGEEEITLNSEWVLYTFNIADSKTQEYFIEELKKVLHSKGDATEYMQKMAGLALNAMA